MDRETRAKVQYERMSKTPIPKLIISLSIPTIISMMVTTIYNLVDSAFVGTLGNSASGAIGVVFGYMAILQAIGFTCGMGSGSLLSRRLGAKDIDSASRYASTGVLLAAVISILVAIISFFSLDWLVMILGSTKTIAPFAKNYIFFLIFAAPFMVTGFTLNNILRYEGRALYGMIGLMSGAILNLGLDSIFIFVLKMGIRGAGLATAFSQVVSFLVLLFPFLSGKTQCRLALSNVQYSFRAIGNIILTGFPSLLRQGLNSVLTILMNVIAGSFGKDPAIAAMSITSRLFFFILAVAIGVGQGFQPFSGFTYGAKNYPRLKKGFWFTTILAEALVVLLSIIFFINAPFLCSLLRKDPTVIMIATRALRLLCISAVVMPLCITTEMLMQSTGHKFLAITLSALRSGLLMIPLLFIMSEWRGLSGVQEAQPIANALGFLPTIFIAIWFFKKLATTKKD